MPSLFTLTAPIAAFAALLALPLASARTGHAAQASPAEIGKVIVDTDFGAPEAPMNATSGARVSGALPGPWSDDSAWARITVGYAQMSEGRRTFTRMTVSRPEEGWAQFRFFMPKPVKGKLYLLRLTLRGTQEMPVQFGIRHRSEPYTMLWQKSLSLAPEWQDHVYVLDAPVTDAEVGFYFLARTLGQVDIDRIRLSEVTREEAGRALTALLPGGSPRNLLAATRFPLGLPAGWSLNVPQEPAAVSRDREIECVADPKTTGPSGAPSLRVIAPQPFRLTGAPFGIGMVTEKHVASVYVRGDVTGTFSVMSEGRQLAKTAMESRGTEWKRIEVPFTPQLSARAYALRFEGGAADFRIDAVQVEQGETARPYTPQQECEAALAVDGPGGVQFVDDPATVRWSVTGAPKGSVLKFHIVNLYGDEAALPPVTLRGDAVQSGQADYARFPNRPLGTYRVEAWIEDARGTRISPHAEVVANRVRRPRFWGKDAPASPFGTHLHASTRDILMAKAIGLNWTRLHDAGIEYIGWNYLEPEKGKWAFRDAELQRFRKHGMKIMGMLSTSPYWASYYPGVPHNGYFDRYYQPKNLAEYADYVKVVTSRYKGVIDTYEIWNEPWNDGWWAVKYDPSQGSVSQDPYVTSEHPQADYARLMKSAYDTAKSVDPKLTIVGFNSTTGTGHKNGISGDKWTQGVLESGGLASCDVVSYHQYLNAPLGFPGDTVEEGYRFAIGPLLEKSARPPKPVWMSEGSPVSGFAQGDGFYQYTLPYPNSDPNIRSGDQVCRFVVGLLAQGVERLFLYTMAARNSFGAPTQWSVLVNSDGTLHPSGVAQAAVAWHLEGTRYARTIEVAPNVRAYLFSGDGRAVAVLTPHEGGTYRPAAGSSLTWTDLWGNPLPAGTAVSGTAAYATLTGGNADALEKALKAGR